jgi:hypothetical protein
MRYAGTQADIMQLRANASGPGATQSQDVASGLSLRVF